MNRLRSKRLKVTSVNFVTKITISNQTCVPILRLASLGRKVSNQRDILINLVRKGGKRKRVLELRVKTKIMKKKKRWRKIIFKIKKIFG